MSTIVTRVRNTLLGVVLAGFVLVIAHLAVIEVGQEVVTLRTPLADGGLQPTRLWIVDDGDHAWLHSGGKDWAARFKDCPIVEIERAGHHLRFRATPVPGPHPRVHELLRAKYGLADRWVRFIGPDNAETLAVRLDPLSDISHQPAQYPCSAPCNQLRSLAGIHRHQTETPVLPTLLGL